MAAKRNALVGAWQEAAAPVHRAAARTAWAALQDDEAGQVARFAADAVRHPRADARAPELAAAGVHEELRRCVVEEVGDAGPHDAELVDNAGGVREMMRNGRA